MRKLKKAALILGAVALLAGGSWQGARAATGFGLSCPKQSGARAQELCEAVEARLEIRFNPHTFTPRAWLPFDRYRDLWCQARVSQTDRAAWEAMAKSKRRALAEAAKGMLTLIESEASGVANGVERQGTIFDPSVPGYLLEKGCEK